MHAVTSYDSTYKPWFMPQTRTNAPFAWSRVKQSLWSNLRSSLQTNRLPRTEEEAIEREFRASSAPSTDVIKNVLTSPIRSTVVSTASRQIAPHQIGMQASQTTISKPDWRTRLSSWSTRFWNIASGAKNIVQQKLQKSPFAQTQRANELQLNALRTTWRKANQENDLMAWLPHWSRTSQEEKRFNAGKTVLQQYDVIAQQRQLTSAEVKEIETIASDLSALANDETEKKDIVLLEHSVLKKKVGAFKGKKALVQEAWQNVQEEIKDDWQKIKEGKKEVVKEVIFDQVVKEIVKKADLVDYLENRIIDRLKEIKILGFINIPESKHKEIARALIKEVGGLPVESSAESIARDVLKGYSDEVHEEISNTIAWYVHNLPDFIEHSLPEAVEKHIEKHPVLAAKIKEKVLPYIPTVQEKALPYVPVIKDKLLPEILRQFEEREIREKKMRPWQTE